MKPKFVCSEAMFNCAQVVDDEFHLHLSFYVVFFYSPGMNSVGFWLLHVSFVQKLSGAGVVSMLYSNCSLVQLCKCQKVTNERQVKPSETCKPSRLAPIVSKSCHLSQSSVLKSTHSEVLVDVLWAVLVQTATWHVTA